mmetsp:Transcript_20460/g.40922  ORF Transcript_20460/g.40922 Transcript_20460/m.40922 type:complete len:124 (-) Transcript_20460:50-421(-)
MDLDSTASWELSSFSKWTSFGILTVVVLYLSLMRMHFNTVRPGLAMRQERERNALEDKYKNAHDRRSHFVHHLAWAKQRGESREELEAIKKKIVAVDSEIDTVEKDIGALYKRHGVRAQAKDS